MKIILSLILLSTTVIATDLPQSTSFPATILSVTKDIPPHQSLPNKPQQGTQFSIPLSPGTSKTDSRQAFLTAVILTTMTDPEINMIYHKKKRSKKDDWKSSEKKDSTEKTYKHSQRNKPREQMLSQYPGRYGGSQK